MADFIRYGLFVPSQGLLHYGGLIERGLLVASACLALVWGAFLLGLLRRTAQPRVLVHRWCREWISPLLIIAVGLGLMGSRSDGGGAFAGGGGHAGGAVCDGSPPARDAGIPSADGGGDTGRGQSTALSGHLCRRGGTGMYAMSAWLASVGSRLTDVASHLEGGVLPWLLSAVLITALSHLGMRLFPGARARRIFASPAPWGWRFLTGEFSLAYTLGWGVAGASCLGWWCFAMGVWPPSAWALALVGGWTVVVVVALLNAGRKSWLSGAMALALSCVIGVLGTLGQWMVVKWLLVVLGAA